MNRTVGILTATIVALLSASLTPDARAAVRPGAAATNGQKGKTIRNLDANAWLIKTTNFGPFVWPASSQPGGFWGGPGYNYIYGGGLWVGALDATDTVRVSMGYHPGTGSSEFGPVNPYTFDWINQAVDPQARVYLSTDPADLSEWPVRDPQNNPVVRSVQDGYAVYSDENPAFTYSGNTPVGVRFKQWSYAWNYADNNDIVFFYFRLFNVSGDSLRNVYIGPCIDADVGDESGAGANDLTDIDYARNLGIQYQTTGEAGWPRVGQFGCRYFESPINNTGDTVWVVDNQFGHAVLPNSALGMTAFKIFIITEDPSTVLDRYKLLTGRNHVSNVMDAYDEWGASNAGDKRFLMSSGPFHLAAGDSAATCVGVMCAWDRPTLIAVSDVAQEVYNNGFQLAVPPEAPQITAAPGDGLAYISWTRVAETTPDPYRAQIDSMPGWHTYFKGTYYAFGKHRVDTALVDSFKIKTGPTTFVAIPRGAANPAGGSDTLEAHYSQRAMYARHDFQGYLLYRANSREDLQDPAARAPVGTLHVGTSGARGYFYDRYDGLQIVLDLQPIVYHTPDTTYYLPKYDTIGTDRGLVCALVDTGLSNGQAYYYGISAYDYQPNVYFTKKCPTTLATSPYASSAMVIPVADQPGYVPPNIAIRVDGGCDARYGGALDHFQNLAVANPPAVPSDSFKIIWQGMTKQGAGTGVTRQPVYRGSLYNSAGTYLDSLWLCPRCARYQGSDPGYSFFGAPHYQLGFGGIVFQPFVLFQPWLAQADTMAVITENPTGSRTYPADSVRVRLDPNTFKLDVAQWMWRGSDYEIRWKDTVVNVGVDTAALTCRIWDVTNNSEVPFEGGLAKGNMTTPGWCFNYLPNTSGTVPYIYNRANNDNTALFISGVTVYLNKKGAVTRRLDWPNRPETGDVWLVNCSGPRPPVDGNITTFILSPAVTGVAGGPVDRLLVALLQQNVPNPFSGATEIAYQLSAPGSVQLRVYNVVGQMVRVLADGPRAAGRHVARWDGRNDAGQKLAAGVYLYRLQAGGQTMTRKLVLVR